MVIFMDKNIDDTRLVRLLEDMQSKFAKEQRSNSILFSNHSDSETYLFIVYYNNMSLEYHVKAQLRAHGQQHVQSILSGKPTPIW